ncbi:sigma factor-like helix-turn-helix DNA-binding protein [Oceanobacillus sp. FSL H7-0719]
MELIYDHGLNNKEVAEVLNKSEQTVSYNHSTALKKIIYRGDKFWITLVC